MLKWSQSSCCCCCCWLVPLFARPGSTYGSLRTTVETADTMQTDEIRNTVKAEAGKSAGSRSAGRLIPILTRTRDACLIPPRPFVPGKKKKKRKTERNPSIGRAKCKDDRALKIWIYYNNVALSTIYVHRFMSISVGVCLFSCTLMRVSVCV